MNIQQIKSSVERGTPVYWSNTGYKVIRDNLGQYLITSLFGSCIGLTNLSGDKLNGQESEFFTIKG